LIALSFFGILWVDDPESSVSPRNVDAPKGGDGMTNYAEGQSFHMIGNSYDLESDRASRHLKESRI